MVLSGISTNQVQLYPTNSLAFHLKIFIVSFIRFGELQTGLAEDGRRRDEMLHSLELSQKERSHAVDAELGRLNQRIADMVEEASRRVAQCEMKLKEEIVAKFTHLEKVFGQSSCL